MTYVIILLLSLVCVYLGLRLRQGGYSLDALNKLNRDIATAQRHNSDLQESQNKLQQECDTLTEDIAFRQSVVTKLQDEKEQAEEKLKNARLLASKELELQNEKLRAKAQEELDMELEALKKDHPLTKYRDMLEALNTKITEARRALEIHQKEVKAVEEEEDFNATHSLDLTAADKADISLLRQWAPQIARKDAVNKLIWTEWYQRPLQNLRRALDADKKIGIYMISEIGSGRMYIGQALNIGERWAEHVKAGLGIGSNAYLTNKFYKALHSKGPESFTFTILELCDKKELNAREKYWIEFYNAQSFGFNTAVGG